jgi:hypothetical protein
VTPELDLERFSTGSTRLRRRHERALRRQQAPAAASNSKQHQQQAILNDIITIIVIIIIIDIDIDDLFIIVLIHIVALVILNGVIIFTSITGFVSVKYVRRVSHPLDVLESCPLQALLSKLCFSCSALQALLSELEVLSLKSRA